MRRTPSHALLLLILLFVSEAEPALHAASDPEQESEPEEVVEDEEAYEDPYYGYDDEHYEDEVFEEEDYDVEGYEEQE